jgi:hypothetical protein
MPSPSRNASPLATGEEIMSWKHLEKCHFCAVREALPILNFGPQPLCNRFKVAPNAEEFTHPLVLGECHCCGLLQLIYPVPSTEIVPRIDWLNYTEPEDHLDNLADCLTRLPDLPQNPKACGISHKDDSLLDRLNRPGYSGDSVV